MKVGDLVKFKGNNLFSAKRQGYPPSGIIIKIIKERGDWGSGPVHKVLWSNGSHTNEYRCYLEVISAER